MYSRFSEFSLSLFPFLSFSVPLCRQAYTRYFGIKWGFSTGFGGKVLLIGDDIDIDEFEIEIELGFGFEDGWLGVFQLGL